MAGGCDIKMNQNKKFPFVFHLNLVVCLIFCYIILKVEQEEDVKDTETGEKGSSRKY